VKGSNANLYAYFDYRIQSEIPLTELAGIQQQPTSADISFHLTENAFESEQNLLWSHHWRTPAETISISFAQDRDSIYLKFRDAACFAIRNHGRLIVCHPSPSTPHTIIRHLLLDQVLPRVFAHFYEHCIFHASFVSKEQQGIAFVGNSGWGKSTLATAFQKTGYTILTDDCFWLDVDKHHVSGTASYCGTRLMPDSLEYAGVKLPTRLTPTHGSKNKLRVQGTAVVPHRTTLQAIFILEPPEESITEETTVITRAHGMKTIQGLLQNSYCLDVQDQHWHKHHFQRISLLTASGLPIYSLRYPRNFSMLPDVVNSICAILASHSL
jgi:hypothetical protein